MRFHACAMQVAGGSSAPPPLPPINSSDSSVPATPAAEGAAASSAQLQPDLSSRPADTGAFLSAEPCGPGMEGLTDAALPDDTKPANTADVEAATCTDLSIATDRDLCAAPAEDVHQLSQPLHDPDRDAPALPPFGPSQFGASPSTGSGAASSALPPFGSGQFGASSSTGSGAASSALPPFGSGQFGASSSTGSGAASSALPPVGFIFGSGGLNAGSQAARAAVQPCSATATGKAPRSSRPSCGFNLPGSRRTPAPPSLDFTLHSTTQVCFSSCMPRAAVRGVCSVTSCVL